MRLTPLSKENPMKVLSAPTHRKARSTKGASKRESLMKISVDIREHEGTFCATSKQVPGFVLVSKDRAAIEADILPAIKMLLAIKAAKQPSKKQAPVAQLAERRELAIAA